MEERIGRLLASVPTGVLVAGEWREAAGGGSYDVENPATGRVIATCASGTGTDALAALDAACAAQDAWAATPARERAEVLRRGFELVRARTDDLALLMTLELGKPLAESRGEVAYGAEFLRWFSEEAPRLAGRYGDTPEGTLRMLVRRRPVGPSLLVTPWNFPLAMATRKVAPALAAGCTVVLKPARLTPLTSHLFAQLMLEAGVPAGVLNVVGGHDAARIAGPLLADPRLRKLSFTGSTAVGRRLLAQAAPNVLRTSMELGGNAPFLVFEDADLPAAVAGAVAAKMRNTGEACTAANRFLVAEPVAEEFAHRLADALGALRVGDGTLAGSQVGPLITADARDGVHAMVSDAVAAGARVLTGGRPVEGPGWFYEPTVLADVPRDARCLREEVFGPVAPVVAFRDEDDAVALANATEYGLAAYAYTRDLSRALRLGDRLETGLLGINAGVISNAAAPFGGVKQSGLGREGGVEGIAEYTETQYIAIAR